MLLAENDGNTYFETSAPTSQPDLFKNHVALVNKDGLILKQKFLYLQIWIVEQMKIFSRSILHGLENVTSPVRK